MRASLRRTAGARPGGRLDLGRELGEAHALGQKDAEPVEKCAKKYPTSSRHARTTLPPVQDLDSTETPSRKITKTLPELRELG